MHISALLALPPTILFLCASRVAAESQWPHNLPKHMKYFPEDEIHVKRSLTIQQRLQREKPIGVRKMSADPGEMFFLDDWIFAGDKDGKTNAKRSTLDGGDLSIGNGTLYAMSPLRPHSEQSLFEPLLRIAPRASLFSRDFKCPDGTNACTSLGAPNSCCSTSDTCIIVPDTGFGSVGCCPQGQTCAGPISCETDKGYTSCPGSSNGGCCLPGYSCQDVGCVAIGTSITYVQPSTSAVIPSSTAVIVVPTTPSALPTSASSSTQTCTSGWFSCSNGGCCRNGQQCGSDGSCIDTSSSSLTSQTPAAPVRPTSNSAVTSDTPSNSVCPTGFYVCSAYYPSGCCRVGRDCQTTGSCAPTASTTVVATNGVIIVAPTGASLATTAPAQGGSCASAWYSCAASLGGNCCPNGYACGEQCTATASSTASVVGKQPLSAGSSFSRTSVWALISGAVAIGVGMIIL
ncbi:hypothetical protein K505DRAFT_640 [Melanomma pulvis-pyrius CBS 109.77]|uniref:GPI anchored protein n=1 Tax=Melanomma pulvis-pyrius CBS 109.77 TaxID=1314802 RepID=A0A6A6Y015_9PLEO|nr:hypothetical protein K505DRAFT_640 [Melanomma pulvis-pyrius CBS 109.77]